MSSRAIRRLQQQQQKQQQHGNKDVEDEEEQHQLTTVRRPPRFQQDNSQSSEEEQEDEKPHTITLPQPQVKQTTKQQGKKKKKNKNKEVVKQKNTDDEFDTFLATNSVPASLPTTQTPTIPHPLSFDTSHLNAENEVRRKLGHGILPPTTKANNKTTRLKHVLVDMETGWTYPPSYLSGGVRMIQLPNSNEYTFEQSVEYTALQSHFHAMVATMDPNNIIQLAEAKPYHVDSLLQLYETFASAGQNETAHAFLRRALFLLESWAAPSFREALGRGSTAPRLSNHGEMNQSFFRALFYAMKLAARRDCFDTAFALCQLLLSLNPVEDPLFVRLHIDTYACLMGPLGWEWIIRNAHHPDLAMPPTVFPNMCYSLALALKWSGKETQATNQLKMALRRFPSFAIDPTTSHSRGDDDGDVDRICSLVAKRQVGLWSKPGMGDWLKSTMAKLGLSDEVTWTAEEIEIHQHYSQAMLFDMTDDPVATLPPDELVGEQGEMEQQHNDAPPNVNVDMNALMLFLQSMMPWAVLPSQQHEEHNNEET